MADTLLKVDGINVYYGNIHAVKDISFTVNAGEIVTLIGANGAGKSTTLKTARRTELTAGCLFCCLCYRACSSAAGIRSTLLISAPRPRSFSTIFS